MTRRMQQILTWPHAICASLVILAAAWGAPCLHAQDVPSTPTSVDAGVSASPIPQEGATPEDGAAAQQAAGATDQTPVLTDEEIVPKQGAVTPNVAIEPISSYEVYTLRLRPLFSSIVRLPDTVTSITVGSPTLIGVEHDKAEPRLVSIKPKTHAKVDSNVIIALQSGQTIAIRVISSGDQGNGDPVDFVLDVGRSEGLLVAPTRSQYAAPPQELPVAPTPAHSLRPEAPVIQPRHVVQESEEKTKKKKQSPSGPTNVITDETPVAISNPVEITPEAGQNPLLDRIYQKQIAEATPHFTAGPALAQIYAEDMNATANLAASLGSCVEHEDHVTLG